ncbi:RidA family protein [Kaistia nematophila]|uniref:RidA family protein n=1 Tax=Kaistia nematophila TaxID=2994654 RepID=UPI003B96A5A9
MEISRLEPAARWCETATHDGVVHVAGQVGQPGADIITQTRGALAEMDRVLALSGTDKSRLLSVTIWLADIADFAAMNSVWDAWIDPANPPARATGGIALADPDYKIEITAVAALP